MDANKTAVFISYAHEDAKTAERLYTDLKAAGADPWLDIKDLRPGQHWKPTIKQAISRCRYFIVLLSSSSVNKRGYVQSELRQALDVLDEFPESDVFLIPVRLDNCQPSNHRLKDLHWVNLFPNWNAGINKLLQTMDLTDGGKDTMDLLKRIYVEANGNEAQMIKAIRGLQRRVDRDTLEITDQEWEYLQSACPGAVVDLLKTIFQRPKTENLTTGKLKPIANRPASRRTRKK